MYLAQLNIAQPLYALDDRRMDGFMKNITFINGEGEKAEGFVWILKDETGGATEIETPFPDMIVNMTVWESLEALKSFVFEAIHMKFIDKKAKWFSEMKEAHFVMWWIDEGHIPSLDEAKERLDHLRENGDSDFAFGWKYAANMTL